MKLAEKREQMLNMVDLWQQSDQTQKEFANENQIALAKLQYWIRQSRNEQHGEFIQLSPPLVSELIIRYPNGVELQLPPQSPMALLKTLIYI